jgi:hypothetical protein
LTQFCIISQVAALQDSADHRLGLRRNAKFNKGIFECKYEGKRDLLGLPESKRFMLKLQCVTKYMDQLG